ncbi:hypothetical protein VN97_g4699 [Penicillium thymicola]|uniref:Uncharacterized protein n=1 Tax=Penicillium thymicola TaxID=293382 RepID=A0AAI9TK46_PENTH|nr:hypothetical protein VN97_g4699 [Penicillium thymicola]
MAENFAELVVPARAFIPTTTADDHQAHDDEPTGLAAMELGVEDDGRESREQRERESKERERERGREMRAKSRSAFGFEFLLQLDEAPA